MPKFRHAVHTANVDLSPLIPWGKTPEKTDGTCIFSEAFSVPQGKSVLVRALLPVLHKNGATAMAAALFIDDQQFAVRTASVTPPGAGYFTPLALEYCFCPGDCLPHTYRIHVGPISGAMVLNGISGTPGFGATMASTLTLEER